MAPLWIGTAGLPNRLGLGPINSSLFDADGSISEPGRSSTSRMTPIATTCRQAATS